MDRSRHPGRVGRLRAALVGAERDLLRAIAAVDSTLVAQLPGLAQPLWQSQRATGWVNLPRKSGVSGPIPTLAFKFSNL